MNRYSDMTIWQLREELAAVKAEIATRDVTPREPNAASVQPFDSTKAASALPANFGEKKQDKKPIPWPAPAAPVAEIVKAALEMDWQQVVLNGGPPCFHLEGGRFCGRAKRWDGHDGDPHNFVSFAALLARLGQRIETRKESEHPSNYEFPPAPGASDD